MPSDYVICHLANAPMRAAASHLSEQSHQLLFGESCQILEPGPLFSRARSLYDHYEGWIDTRQFLPLTTAPPTLQLGSVLCDDLLATAVSPQRTIHLPMGSLLPEYAEGNFSLGAETFHFQGQAHHVRPLATVFELVAYGFRYLHAPYQWGARSPLGIDCSGLTQMVYRAFAIPLLRDASQQRTQGQAVASLADARPGDLVFLKGTRQPGAGIDHVGLVYPAGKVLHASGCVRLDDLTSRGIHHAQTREHTHALVEIRRIL
jgi:gamma-D-glutamyl-L-lysine dipeptidyl-peptidase